MQGGGVAHDRDAAVVGGVECLVRVGRPRVGLVHTLDEVAQSGRGGRPQAERAVDVHPGPVVVGEPDRLGERVERARVQVAGLQADHRRTAGRAVAERPAQRIGPHPSLIVDLDPFRSAEAEVAQRQMNRGVAVVADDHPKPAARRSARASRHPSRPSPAARAGRRPGS